MHVDWLVVGAGLTGATLAERIASQLGAQVLVVDRRSHLAGNAYDEIDEVGIRVHRYGAHLFHTCSTAVWSYLSQFTRWRPYVHRVKAHVDGQLVPLPFNLTSIETLLPPRAARRACDRLVAAVGPDGRIPVLALLDHDDPVLRDLGELVYEKVFVNYTTKQWGLRPEEVDRSVTGRVPVLASRDDRYFRDRYQALPEDGYTAMVARMLDRPNIAVELGVDHRELEGRVGYDQIVYTGPIDEYLGYCFGPLPYRSLRFEHEVVAADRFQEAAVVNYPNEHAFTRIVEHAWFSGKHVGASSITREYPDAYEPGANEPYYPVPGPANRAAYDRYRRAAEDVRPAVFAGRLARYRYLDMDEAVGLALAVFRHEVVGRTLLKEGAR